MGRLIGACTLVLGLCLAALPAGAAKRVALVVGNDAYDNVRRLQKAVNDARTIGRTLETLGFEVIFATDVARRDMNRQIQTFMNRIEPGDEAMFFYAGHAVEIKGLNYLLPTDIPAPKPGQEGFVTDEAIGLNGLHFLVPKDK